MLPLIQCGDRTPIVISLLQCELAHARPRLRRLRRTDETIEWPAIMFKGKAELVDPEKDTQVATFTEICQSEGAAKMRVVLKTPMIISGTERLAIYSTIKDQEVIAVTADGGASTEIHEFE